MQLIRCQDQKTKTLDEFYAEMSHGKFPGTSKSGEAMLNLMTRLRALPDHRSVYGLTSHQRLCLLATNSYLSPWFVIVSSLDKNNYYIEYLMPEHVSPWPHAYVRGEARSEEDAVKLILIAMDKSEGWSNNSNQ